MRRPLVRAAGAIVMLSWRCSRPARTARARSTGPRRAGRAPRRPPTASSRSPWSPATTTASTRRRSPCIPGKLRVVLDNTGKGAPHDFQVTGFPATFVPLAAAGEKVAATFTVPPLMDGKATTYEFVCTIHVRQGQIGKDDRRAMNVLDLIIVVAAIAYGFTGFRNGAVIGAFSLVGFFAGAALGAQLASPLGSWLADGHAQVPIAIVCVLMLAHARPADRHLDRRARPAQGRSGGAGVPSTPPPGWCSASCRCCWCRGWSPCRWRPRPTRRWRPRRATPRSCAASTTSCPTTSARCTRRCATTSTAAGSRRCSATCRTRRSSASRSRRSSARSCARGSPQEQPSVVKVYGDARRSATAAPRAPASCTRRTAS